jgi:hypothetical protein
MILFHTYFSFICIWRAPGSFRQPEKSDRIGAVEQICAGACVAARADFKNLVVIFVARP